jgi:asparagine synthase (glutamine-hydrolysing)
VASRSAARSHRDRFAALLDSRLDPVTQMSLVEVHTYLRDTLLRDADAMSMAHSLEVRPVLLDHPLATFLVALPPEAKLQGGVAKRIFVDALRDLLPVEILARPKRGFDLPLLDWIDSELRDRVFDTLSSPCAEEVFSKKCLRKFGRTLRGGGPISPLHWASFVLVEVLKRHKLSM